MEKDTSGKLYIVATPIGNLGDITLRALQVLESVDAVAAEDTRRTVKLLNHFDIKKKLISFHEYSNEARYRELLEMLKCGREIALVTDAGTPVISDPGYELVARCAREGIAVESLPGACAAITAVTVSGLDCRRFLFWGFLNAKRAARKKELQKIKEIGQACVIYESPNRILKTLEDVEDVCGGQTQVCVCRELTKVYEEILRGTAREVAITLRARGEAKGEFVLVLSFEDQEKKEVSEDQITERLRECLDSGMTRKDAVAAVSDALGVPKNRTYQILLTL